MILGLSGLCRFICHNFMELTVRTIKAVAGTNRQVLTTAVCFTFELYYKLIITMTIGMFSLQIWTIKPCQELITQFYHILFICTDKCT